MNRIVAAVLLCAAVLSCSAGAATKNLHETGRSSAGTSGRLEIAGEYIVALRGRDSSALREAFGKFSVIEIKSSASGNVFLVRIKNDPGPDEMSRAAARHPSIASVQRNVTLR